MEQRDDPDRSSGGEFSLKLKPPNGLFRENQYTCDCRRIMFAVWSSVTQQIEAYIGFGWEGPEFYHKWCPGLSQADVEELIGPSLNSMSQQVPWGPAILRHVVHTAIDNPEYVERIKRHYQAARKPKKRGNRKK